MTKVNQQTMKTQYDGQYDTFCRKNHDYGNSFEESLDQFGIVASIVRMSDKMKRLESLTDESKTQQVGSESLLDTLEDLSNYAAMTACWLRGIREEDGETSCCPDMIDVIKYNVQDAKNVMSRSPEIYEDPALKLTIGMGKSRALLSRQTGMDCFDLELEHFIDVANNALKMKDFDNDKSS